MDERDNGDAPRPTPQDIEQEHRRNLVTALNLVRHDERILREEGASDEEIARVFFQYGPAIVPREVNQPLTPEQRATLAAQARQQYGTEDQNLSPEQLRAYANIVNVTNALRRTPLMDEIRNRYASLPEDQREQRIENELTRIAIDKALLDPTGSNLTKEDYDRYTNSYDRAHLKLLAKNDPEEFEKHYEIIKVTTPQGYPIEFIWPKNDREKILLLRKIMFDIEDNVLQESSSHQAALQELALVTNYFKTSLVPKTAKFGESLFQEYYRRLQFLQAYAKFAFANDVNGVIEGFSGLYGMIQNKLMRESTHLYDEADLHDAGLYTQAFFRWYEKNWKVIENARESELPDIRKRAEAEVQALYRTTLPKETLESSSLLAMRYWELTLRKARYNDLVHKDTRQSYELLATKPDPNDPTKQVPDEEKRRLEKQRLMLDAHQSKVEFRCTPTLGNLNARNIGAKWMYTHVKNYGLQIELIDGLDFNFRDPFSAMGDNFVEELTGKLRTYYQAFEPDRFDHAEHDAIELAKAIMGVDDPKRNKPKGDEEGFMPLDISKMAYKVEDFDDLVKEEKIDEAEKTRRLKEIEKYIRIKRDEHGRIKIEPLSDSEQDKARAKVLEKGNLFDFDWVDPTPQRVTRYVKGPDDWKGQFMFADGHESYGRHPTAEKAVAFLGKTDFMRQGRYERQVRGIVNFEKHQYAHQYMTDKFATDLEVAGFISRLNLKQEQVDALMERLRQDHQLYKGVALILGLHSADLKEYGGKDTKNIILYFLGTVLLGILSEIFKGTGR